MLAATYLVVGGDDDLGTGVVDAVTQTLCGEAAEHHRVGGADAGAGLHSGHTIDGHGDVNHHAITLLHALGAQGIGHAAGFGQQLAVSDFGDFAAIGFKNECGLVAQAFFDVAVQAVVGGVQSTVCKPLEERGIAFIQGLGERGFPIQQLTGLPGPEAFVVGLGFLTQCVVGVHARNGGVLNKGWAGLVNADIGGGVICTHEVS